MAARSLNRCQLLGNLGRDAEVAWTASQVSVTKFSVATTRRWKDKGSGEWREETNWTNCVMWRGENLAPYLTKGKKVLVEGRLQTRSYDDKDGRKVYVTEVITEDVILLGDKGGGGGGGGDEYDQRPVSQPRGGPPRASAPPEFQESPAYDDTDVPF